MIPGVETIGRRFGWCPNQGAVRVQSGTGPSEPVVWSTTKNRDARMQGMDGPGTPRRSYEHTQVGLLQIYAVLGITAVIIGISLLVGAHLVPLIVLGILVFAALCFATLTVTIAGGAVRIRFGPIGIVGREFPLADIASVEAVRNPWYYGYGIRWTPHGPLYNVAGNDAVELSLSSGKRVRIGTDEPGLLVQAIERARR